jgi:hypothetical protein
MEDRKMVKRVFVFIVSLAALVSIGLVKCAGNMPYADSSPTGLDTAAVISTSYLCEK